ncbi:DUF1918 domain-containing protein [Streptomyces sp. Rer75]|uniref:DUF1918 domain-containing protein n=1 Tax=Streptomyces sp. Rer75 TaxID=2750011 RepID=UPI0035A0D0B6
MTSSLNGMSRGARTTPRVMSSPTVLWCICRLLPGSWSPVGFPAAERGNSWWPPHGLHGPSGRPFGPGQHSPAVPWWRRTEKGTGKAGPPMRAHVGDQLIIESPTTGAARRDGEIVGLHHDDGTPPYDVRWSDSDRVSLVFPGPDAHIHHIEHVSERPRGPAAPGHQ